ncbi:MAG: DUF167 domain-containing protein [Euryarchaeota archaeon]|nr:DUF167 domain-containing protein [Euryarchaeota archaeon]
MKFTGALTEVAEGVLIRAELTPSARSLGISGYNQWRQTICIKLTMPAKKGKANEQLIKFIANLFDRPTRAVRLVSGHTSNRKVLLLSDAIVDDVELVIEQAMKRRSV